MTKQKEEKDQDYASFSIPVASDISDGWHTEETSPSCSSEGSSIYSRGYECTSCHRAVLNMWGRPPSMVRTQRDGSYVVDCGYGSDYDVETFKFNTVEAWVSEAANATDMGMKALCDICNNKSLLLRTITLFRSHWRSSTEFEFERRPSFSDTANYWPHSCVARARDRRPSV